MKQLFPFIILAFFSSCKKEDINFPQTLYLKKVTASTNVRLFINKIEIFDKSVIDNFTNRTSIFNLQNQAINPALYIKFFSKDSASFNSPTFRYSVTVNGNQFLFKSPPYLTSLIFLPDGITIYPPEITPWGTNAYIVKETTVGFGNFMKLDISLFAYSLVRSNSNSGYYQRSNATIFNQFNPNFINTLGQTDTLAIQEFTETFETN
jgi:hypothetical protein